MGHCTSKPAPVVVEPNPPTNTQEKHSTIGQTTQNETSKAKITTSDLDENKTNVQAKTNTDNLANSVEKVDSANQNGVGLASKKPRIPNPPSKSLEQSNHSASGGNLRERDLSTSGHSTSNGKVNGLVPSSSVLGLDQMIDDRRTGGDLKNNIVHMEVPFGKPIEEVYDGVHDGPVLGSGISGLVRLCTHTATGAKYAVKCLDLGLVETEEGLQQLREEIAIMCQLDHPNIVRLEEVYESHSEIYLVQELCVGGELFDRLDEQPDYHYTEAQCARLIKQMICSIRYIHTKGIIHRDLKLENFLFSTRDPDSDLKMIDFGLSKHFKYGEVHHEAVGTPYTVAPEVIRGSYDERCDVWALGVIAYLLLSGDPPFGGCGGPESLMQVRSNILRGAFVFEPQYIWSHISQQAMDFIRSLLVTDPTMRPTAAQCQKLPWLLEFTKENKESTRLNPNVVKALVNFKEYSDMRKLLCEVLSFTLLPDQITDLRKEFEKLDTDGSGEISLEGLKKVLISNAGAGSLGALTEKEVEDIFNAMRVGKTETRIHWHEFIAAGLSQCKVDDRNLKLAFDRLDCDHKGYVTFDNVMDLMGRDAADSEDAMRQMWGDSMRACNNHSSKAHITYEDFLLLMKGQTRDGETKRRPSHPGYDNSGFDPKAFGNIIHEVPSIVESSKTMAGNLEVLHEVSTSDGNDTEGDDMISPNSPSVEEKGLLSEKITPFGQTILEPPNLDSFNDVFEDDMPLSMDEENEDEALDKSADLAMLKAKSAESFTPPQSPVRGPKDFITPTSERFRASPDSQKLIDAPALPLLEQKTPLDTSRRRSKSVDAQETLETKDEEDLQPPHLLPLYLPEHTHNQREIDSMIKDETVTPLVVNRKLYRAHRQMRLAVLEASKRFEDQQFTRTKAELQAKQKAEEASVRFGAGLVMRRGLKKELSSEAIRGLMRQKQEEQQTLVERATRRGGRGKRTRKKTISDMSGMLSLMPDISAENNNTETTMFTSLPTISDSKTIKPIPIRAGNEKFYDSAAELPLHDTAQREATVPGVFRKTHDPFEHVGSAMMGLFGKKKSDKKDQLGMSNSSHMKVSLSDGQLNEQDEDLDIPSPSRTTQSIAIPQNDQHAPSPAISGSWPQSSTSQE